MSIHRVADNEPHAEHVNASWFEAGFPLGFRRDIREATAVLAALGYDNDPQLGDLRSTVRLTDICPLSSVWASYYITADVLEEMKLAYGAWATHPGAFFALAHGEAVAKKA